MVLRLPRLLEAETSLMTNITLFSPKKLVALWDKVTRKNRNGINKPSESERCFLARGTNSIDDTERIRFRSGRSNLDWCTGPSIGGGSPKKFHSWATLKSPNGA